jgi:two-component system sensor histidine kinase RegB
MTDFSPADNFSNLRIDAKRTVVLRWCLLAALAVAVSLAPTFLDIALPWLLMFVVIALMAVFNAYAQHRAGSAESVDAGELFRQLCVDLVALAILLYLSGGAANPLISLLLVPVTVAALSLSGTLTAAVAVLSIVLYTFLVWFYLPLSVADVERATRLHLAGMWLTFVVSVAMIAWFIARMTASVRERDMRLAAAREKALRDERVVALGALAAGAAHELGTPLATIAVVIGELEREVFQNAEVHADLALVQEQIARCKSIISSLSARAGAPRLEQADSVDAIMWLESVCSRWHSARPHALGRLVAAKSTNAPMLVVDQTLEQAINNLLNNAADAAPDTSQEIGIALDWDAKRLQITISDKGPGFPADVLRNAGKIPLVTGKGGAGIGLFLAFSAVERLGGRIELENPHQGGGRVRIDLPRLPGPEE